VLLVLYFLHIRSAWYPRGRAALVDVFRAYWYPVAPATVFCACTYALNILPYVAIHRTTFAYHYMPAIVYGELLLALVSDRLLGLMGVSLVGAVTGAAWVFWSPWVLGLSLSKEGHARRRWLERWS
jgi:dolichyl-phosphate-mannose--protein O-mannosyl transferase